MEIWEAKNVKILKYDYTELMKCGVKEEDAILLSKFGVPEATAPGLSFRLFESQIPDRNGEEYLILGFTGSGDEICLEKMCGKIIILDHEMDDNILLNSSIRKMYECLGCYTDFIDQIRKKKR